MNDARSSSPTGPSDSSSALERLRLAQHQPPAEPAAPPQPTDQTPPPAAPELVSRPPARQPKKTPVSDWINRHLDGLGSPDRDRIEHAVASAPTRTWATVQRWRARRIERAELKEERRRAEAARAEAQAQAEAEHAAYLAQLKNEISEVQKILRVQEAEREAQREERERLATAQLLEAQHARETAALKVAARELDGTDYVPPAEHRPMLQESGEELSDEQLLDRARTLLPEWRRRERIVEKARAIEKAAATAAAEAAAASAAASNHTTQREHDPLFAPAVDGAPYVPPYLLPSRGKDPAPAHLDGFRRTTVTLAWLLMVTAGLFGLGWVGNAESLHAVHEGQYFGQYSLLSMAVWHTAIWPVLWVGMGLYTLHQWMPSQRSALRQRATGWYAANAMLAVALWFMVTHLQSWGLEAILWFGATALMVRAIQNLNLHTARTRSERAFTDIILGFLTGWLVAFSLTTASVVLTRWEINLLWIPGAVWAVAGLLITVWGTAMLTMTERGRLTIALGLSWGLAAIIGARLFGSTTSLWVIIVAAIGAFVVLLTTENRRYRIGRAERRAQEDAAEFAQQSAP